MESCTCTYHSQNIGYTAPIQGLSKQEATRLVGGPVGHQPLLPSKWGLPSWLLHEW